MLRATGLLNVPEEAPLVELLKDLAEQMDTTGGARIAAAYLSAQKDLRRVLAVSSGRPPKTTAEPVVEPSAPAAGESFEESEDQPKVSSLGKFKERKGIVA